MMHNRTVSKNDFEIISTSADTGVRFYTSIDSGSYILPHWHPAIEILYLLEGELTVTSESTEQFVSAGHCILINAGTLHATRCIKPNKAIVFQIPLDFISIYLPDIQNYQFHLPDSSESTIIQTKIDCFKDTLLQMQLVNDVQPDGFVFRFNSLLFEVLYQLYHNFSVQVLNTEINQHTKDLNRINVILDYINENYRRSISLQEIANIAGFHPNYFCRFFKKNMGMSFLEYQNRLRLSHIYQDLKETDLTVHDLLEKHGFSNYKLFRKMFREVFHSTPTELRTGRTNSHL